MTTTLNDPMFGRLTWKPSPGEPANCYWEGESVFTPLQGKVSLLIQGDERGPGEAQRTLYREIETRWDELRLAVADALKAFHRDVLDETLTDVWGVYSLAQVWVPGGEAPDMQWQLGFDSTTDPNHLYVVEFEGWEPTGAVEPQG